MNRLKHFIQQNWVSMVVIGVCVTLLTWWVKSSQLPIPEAEKSKPSNQITDSDWYVGNKNAPVIVVEYSDFQCPACSKYSEVDEQLVSLLGDKVGIAYRHFPLREIHKNANLAAQAAEAAGKQGKFWEMAAVLFQTQSEWSNSNQPLVLFNTYAKQIGVDPDKLVKEITNPEIKALVEADYLSGLVAKINATPTFFVNGQKMNNLSGPDDLVARIELTLQEATASAKK